MLKMISLDLVGKMLKNLQEITKQEAKKIAAEFMNTTPESLREEADVNSEIELYCFSKGDMAVALTKKGGKLCASRSFSLLYNYRNITRRCLYLAFSARRRLGNIHLSRRRFHHKYLT